MQALVILPLVTNSTRRELHCNRDKCIRRSPSGERGRRKYLKLPLAEGQTGASGLPDDDPA